MAFGYCQCDEHIGEKSEQHLHKHHRAQQKQYPQFADDPDNLILVCPSCHAEKIHDNGNYQKLSSYGERLRVQYLTKKGFIGSVVQETQSSVGSYPTFGRSSGSSSGGGSSPISIGSSVGSDSSLFILLVFFGFLIFVFELYFFGRAWGWSIWTLLAAIIVTFLVIGVIYILFILLIMVIYALWHTGVKIYNHFSSR